jgi:hypothetical protein
MAEQGHVGAATWNASAGVEFSLAIVGEAMGATCLVVERLEACHLTNKQPVDSWLDIGRALLVAVCALGVRTGEALRLQACAQSTVHIEVLNLEDAIHCSH